MSQRKITFSYAPLSPTLIPTSQTLQQPSPEVLKQEKLGITLRTENAQQQQSSCPLQDVRDIGAAPSRVSKNAQYKFLRFSEYAQNQLIINKQIQKIEVNAQKKYKFTIPHHEQQKIHICCNFFDLCQKEERTYPIQ